MVAWECPIKPREASGLDPEAVHLQLQLSVLEFHCESFEVRRIHCSMMTAIRIQLCLFDEQLTRSKIL